LGLSVLPRFRAKFSEGWQAFSEVFRCFFATLPKIFWLTPPWILCYNGPNEVFSGLHSGSLRVHPAWLRIWILLYQNRRILQAPENTPPEWSSIGCRSAMDRL